MKKTISTALAGLAVAALPLAAADAKPGRGNSDSYSNDNSASAPDETRDQRRQARRCKRGRKVGFAVRGTLAGFTAEDVTLTVARANKHARSFIDGDTHTFALDGARVKFEGVTDADADGDVDFADVAPTDRVKATGKVIRPKRGCEAEPTVTVRKIQVERPEADEAEKSDES